MHQLYFVYLEKEMKIKTSQEARNAAIENLNENNFADCDSGYFGSSKADWFVIGGRWSGILTEALGEKPSPDRSMRYAKKDQCKSNGYKDDAIKLDKKLLEAIQNKKNKYKYIRTCEVFLSQKVEETKIANLTEKDLGSWLVVVDYHF